LEGCSLDCQTLLANGDVDVSVRMFTKTQLGENRSYAQNLAFTKLAENYVGVVLRNDYPAICDGQVDLAKLREETFCFRAFDEKTQCDPKIECFREACRSEGFEPILQFYKDIRPGAVYAMAAKGLCVIPSMHPPTSLYPGLCYVPLTKQYYSFTIGMQYRKDNPSLAVKRFIKCAQEHARLFSADSSSVSLK